MRVLVIALIAGIWLSSSASIMALAQEMDPAARKSLDNIAKSAPATEESTTATAQDDSNYGAFRIQQEITHRYLLIVVIVAAVASLVIVLLFLKLVGTRDSIAMVNATGLVLVVYGTILVVMISRADQQLTAAIGILGAVAGYLFGSSTRPRTGTAAEPGDKSDATQR